jgi:hypothetical protein
MMVWISGMLLMDFATGNHLARVAPFARKQTIILHMDVPILITSYMPG